MVWKIGSNHLVKHAGRAISPGEKWIFMKKIVLLLIGFAFAGCLQSQSKQNSKQKGQSNNAADSGTQNSSTRHADSDTCDDQETPCGNYLVDYKEAIHLDTFINIKNRIFRVSAITDTQKKIELPAKFLFTCRHQYIYNVCLKIVDTTIRGKELLLNRTNLSPYILPDNKNLFSFGSPHDAVIFDVDKENNKIGIRINFVIPYTDLAQELTVFCDLQKMALCANNPGHH